jgi:(1->4)-alpha-D-glucan 1-alpha-D-glucosylmutase
LQFNGQFTFQHALAVSQYLSELGISDCYASPLLQAAPHTTHGYDVCGLERLNPELGGETDFAAWMHGLQQLGLGLLLDIVPNHMAAHYSNRLWRDVLANGTASPFASWFEIDWRRTGKAGPAKILLPVLEAHYGKVLEAGALQIVAEGGTFLLAYGDARFPLSPGSLRKFRDRLEGDLEGVNGRRGKPASFDTLDQLLQNQHYRLAYWRVGFEELNYRRFFDVTGLIGLRSELPKVFEAAHGFIFKCAREGKLSGVRVDHPDGLWNPKQYFERLRRHLRAAIWPTKRGQGLPYVVAEKILTGDEPLPQDWPIQGTTGYDFLNQVNGLFVDSRHREALTQLYREFTGCTQDFRELVRRSKRLVLQTLFQSELDMLTHRLKRLAATSRHGADFTFTQLRAVLSEVLVAFPVYRTYITAQKVPVPEEKSARANSVPLRPEEKEWIQGAFREARENKPMPDGQIRDWLESVFLLKPLRNVGQQSERRRIEFVMRFQQFTGPLMAKSLEDTAFYNFNRLVSLNEVGGDPERFGISVATFHQRNLSRAKHWPHSLLATTTHDTKRGEDVRARLNVLSEMPEEWGQTVRSWHDLNAAKRTPVGGEPAPHPNDEYLLYQTLVGAWGPEAETADGLKTFAERIMAFMLKAVKEAKTHTSWLEPNSAYEHAVHRFVMEVLSRQQSSEFLSALQAFQRRVAFFGRFNSLSQLLLKLTAPGVPDIYQGTELWDCNLVDPDNRRPVDFELRRRLLAGLVEKVARAGGQPLPWLEELLRNSDTGEIKLYVLWRALNFRRTYRDLFGEGDYVPLSVRGRKQEHACAFARRWKGQGVLIVVPRLVLGLTGGSERPPTGAIWEDTVLEVPKESNGQVYRNVFTRESHEAKGTTLRLQDLLAHFPIGLFEKLTSKPVPETIP